MTDYLSGLNPEQREAVEAVDGPLLVLAGAGTGKTRVLTTRFAHILLTGRAFPGQVLAVTFTNKAAREMRERVGAMLGRPAEGLWLGTFHALCARMLRRHAGLVGLTASFNILDADDQLRLLKQVMEADGLDTKRWPPPALMALIQRWKDRGLPPASPRRRRPYRFRRRARRAALRRLPGPPARPERGRFRRSAAAHDGNPARPTPTCWRSTTACSAIFSWTNTRTPTWCNTCGCGCWRSRTVTSAASAMTTSRSIRGAAPRSRTSCVSRRIFRAHASSAWSGTTARPRRSWPPPPG